MFLSDGNGDELVRRSAGLGEALERIGLYVNEQQVVDATMAGPGPMLFVSATIGRVAFSDRVQRPDQAVIDEQFEDIADGLVEAEFEERRRALDD